MGFLLDSGADTVPRWPLAGLRVYGGLVFCGASLAELMGRQAWPMPPNAALDPPAVLVLELLVGVALVLGVVSRAAALIGVALMAGRLIAAGLKPADLVSPGPTPRSRFSSSPSCWDVPVESGVWIASSPRAGRGIPCGERGVGAHRTALQPSAAVDPGSPAAVLGGGLPQGRGEQDR